MALFNRILISVLNPMISSSKIFAKSAAMLSPSTLETVPLVKLQTLLKFFILAPAPFTVITDTGIP